MCELETAVELLRSANDKIRADLEEMELSKKIVERHLAEALIGTEERRMVLREKLQAEGMKLVVGAATEEGEMEREGNEGSVDEESERVWFFDWLVPQCLFDSKALTARGSNLSDSL